MSRARESAFAYVVADNAAQAIEDLRREWSVERRVGWAIDRGAPAPALAADQDAHSAEAVLRLGRLRAERDALVATIPADPTPEIVGLNAKLHRLQQDQHDLDNGGVATPAPPPAKRQRSSSRPGPAATASRATSAIRHGLEDAPLLATGGSGVGTTGGGSPGPLRAPGWSRDGPSRSRDRGSERGARTSAN